MAELLLLEGFISEWVENLKVLDPRRVALKSGDAWLFNLLIWMGHSGRADNPDVIIIVIVIIIAVLVKKAEEEKMNTSPSMGVASHHSTLSPACSSYSCMSERGPGP